jgi:hypothetical protein
VFAYFSSKHNIQLIDFAKVDTNKAGCLACDVCKEPFYYAARVGEKDVDKMRGLGWN